MATPLNLMVQALKSILILVISLILLLGIVGGGWGPKRISPGHPLYNGELKLIAHRGVSDRAPENTVAAALRARQLGFEIIEIDIKGSVDKYFFLFHDRNSKRLFGKEVPLKRMTLEQLQLLPLWYNGRPSDHRVPELEEFRKEIPQDLNMYIDVKRHGNNQYNQLANRVAHFLERHQISQSSLVGSDFLFTAYLEFKYPVLHTVFTGPGDWTIIFYKCIPRNFRPDFIISYANEVTEWHLEWLQRNDLMKRRMLYGVDSSNYSQVKKWGVPKLVVEYHPVMDGDLDL